MNAEEYLNEYFKKEEELTANLRQQKCSHCKFKGQCSPPMKPPTHDCYDRYVIGKLLEWRKPFWNDKLKEEVKNLLYGRRK